MFLGNTFMLLLSMERAFALRSIRLFCVSLISSLSVHASSSPQICMQEACLLSANLACPATGLGDLMSPIGQSMRQAHIDSYSGATINPDMSPWSYKPVCTETLEGIGSKLCVYTNTTFSGGRGISIFTTPQIAEGFAALLPFQDSAALDGINSSEGPWYTQSLPDRGIGAMAKRDIGRKDLIMAYTPTLLVYRENSLSTWKREKFLRTALDQLPFSTRQSYLGLATSLSDSALIAQDVVNTNAYDIEVGGQIHGAVFPEISRINHDCAPNSQYYVDPTLLTHYVHAIRPISRGREITVSYLNVLHPYASRQQYLLDAFHFVCSCSRCKSKSKSDNILAHIDSLQQTLGDWGPQSTATTEKAEKLIQLYKEDGLDSILNQAYGYAALTYSAFGDAVRARTYAELTAEAVALKDGPAATDLKMWTEMMENPKKHWSWRRKKH